MKRFIEIDDLDLQGKRVLVRVDFNVPIKDGQVADDSRIKASLPTIQQLLSKQAQILLVSHLGRPKEGEPEEQYSLAPVANALAKLLNMEVPLIKGWLQGIDTSSYNIVLLENVRFEKGEKANADDLAKHMASLCDVYVNDAFATAHRAQASTHGVARYAPVACAGPLLVKEIDALSKAVENPARPVTAIVGGSKISTKLTVLESLLNIVDQLIVGGGIANTFLAAAGYNIGNSLNEQELIPVAQELLTKAKGLNKEIPLPTDAVCGKELSESAEPEIKKLNAIAPDDIILDVGPETAAQYSSLLANAQTIIWNGPVGVFEFEQFKNGTKTLAKAIAESKAFSLAGGGDTLAAITKFNVADKVSYISTGGGAFLEFIEGKELPAVAILKESAQTWFTGPGNN